MKIKKWFALGVASVMALGGLTFSACGGGNTEDNNVNYTITIVDQDGDKVEGVVFNVLQGTETIATLTTDTDGVASGTANAGDYTVSYTQMPSAFYDANPETAWIEINTAFSISKENPNATLVISNWTLGTSLNAYTCYYETDEETGEVSDAMYVPTVLANSDNYYLVSKSGDRTICIEQADVTIIYNGTTYSAQDGAIEIQSHAPVAGDLNYWALFQIFNETDADIQLVMTFKEEVDDYPEEDSSLNDESAEEDSAV